MTSSEADDLARRRARRAFIRAYHPDVGGDPGGFAEGLAGFADPAPAPAAARPDVTAFHRRTVGRSLVRSVRVIRRRLAGRPPRRLL